MVHLVECCLLVRCKLWFRPHAQAFYYYFVVLPSVCRGVNTRPVRRARSPEQANRRTAPALQDHQEVLLCWRCPSERPRLSHLRCWCSSCTRTRSSTHAEVRTRHTLLIKELNESNYRWRQCHGLYLVRLSHSVCQRFWLNTIEFLNSKSSWTFWGI